MAWYSVEVGFIIRVDACCDYDHTQFTLGGDAPLVSLSTHLITAAVPSERIHDVLIEIQSLNVRETLLVCISSSSKYKVDSSNILFRADCNHRNCFVGMKSWSHQWVKHAGINKMAHCGLDSYAVWLIHLFPNLVVAHSIIEVHQCIKTCECLVNVKRSE